MAAPGDAGSRDSNCRSFPGALPLKQSGRSGLLARLVEFSFESSSYESRETRCRSPAAGPADENRTIPWSGVALRLFQEKSWDAVRGTAILHPAIVSQARAKTLLARPHHRRAVHSDPKTVTKQGGDRSPSCRPGTGPHRLPILCLVRTSYRPRERIRRSCGAPPAMPAYGIPRRGDASPRTFPIAGLGAVQSVAVNSKRFRSSHPLSTQTPRSRLGQTL